MSYSYLDGIRIRALAGVMDPDEEYTLRDIFRWYSEKFSTPLHEVENIPLESVLLNWFEVQYQDLEPEEQEFLAKQLIETPDEKKAREIADQQSEEAFIRKAKEMNAKKQAKQEQTRKMFLKQLKKFTDEKESVEAEPAKKEEEIVVKYAPVGDLEAELDKPTGPPPGTRKPR